MSRTVLWPYRRALLVGGAGLLIGCDQDSATLRPRAQMNEWTPRATVDVSRYGSTSTEQSLGLLADQAETLKRAVEIAPELGRGDVVRQVLRGESGLHVNVSSPSPLAALIDRQAALAVARDQVEYAARARDPDAKRIGVVFRTPSVPDPRPVPRLVRRRTPYAGIFDFVVVDADMPIADAMELALALVRRSDAARRTGQARTAGLAIRAPEADSDLVAQALGRSGAFVERIRRLAGSESIPNVGVGELIPVLLAH